MSCIDSFSLENQEVDFEQIKKMVKVFTSPEYAEVYETSLKVIQNWADIQDRTALALNELDQGKCARCGYVFGKLIREIMMSDASLSSALGMGVDYIQQQVGEGVQWFGKGFQSIKGYFSPDEL